MLQLLLILFQFQNILSKYIDYEDTKFSSGLSNLMWDPHLQGLEDLKFPDNFTHEILRGKRFTSLRNLDQMPNKPYQKCLAPGEKVGHCRHVQKCILEDFRANFSRFLDYFCIIEQSYVGVCCPDDATMEPIQDSTFANNVIGYLPAIASDLENGKPVWDSVELGKDNNSTSNGMTNNRKPRSSRGCGMSSNSKVRVVDGQPAQPKEWPWMVALLRKNNIQYCGGVLITDRHILSAAHCFQGMKKSEITVRLGEYDFSKTDETRALDFKVVDLRIHQDFDDTNYENDIAIIKIHRPTVFNTYIWPICLPPINTSFDNKNAIITGWGSQYYAGPVSSILMEVSVPIWPRDKCSKTLTFISDKVLCAGAYEGGKDSCQGDSGGPLLHQLSSGRWVVIGIVSWGIRCGEPDHPGIYTKVSSYLDWIFANAIF